MAIIKSTRGTGAGRILCEALEEHVRERRGKAADVTRGKSSIELLAYSQKIAEGFYTKMGWHSIGPDFIEVGRRRPLRDTVAFLALASDVDILGCKTAHRKDNRTSKWSSGSNSRQSPPP